MPFPPGAEVDACPWCNKPPTLWGNRRYVIACENKECPVKPIGGYPDRWYEDAMRAVADWNYKGQRK